jgi:hypothetical protein
MAPKPNTRPQREKLKLNNYIKAKNYIHTTRTLITNHSCRGTRSTAEHLQGRLFGLGQLSLTLTLCIICTRRAPNDKMAPILETLETPNWHQLLHRRLPHIDLSGHPCPTTTLHPSIKLLVPNPVPIVEPSQGVAAPNDKITQLLPKCRLTFWHQCK